MSDYSHSGQAAQERIQSLVRNTHGLLIPPGVADKLMTVHHLPFVVGEYLQHVKLQS